jgi:hypothetical protein
MQIHDDSKGRVTSALPDWRGHVPDQRRPIGTPLNLKDDPNRVIEVMRLLGDFPAADKPNSTERPGHFPGPGENYSLQAAQQWLETNPDAWKNIIVYGFQGYNRYMVHGDGSVSLIESQFHFTNGIEDRQAALHRARVSGLWLK